MLKVKVGEIWILGFKGSAHMASSTSTATAWFPYPKLHSPLVNTHIVLLKLPGICEFLCPSATRITTGTVAVIHHHYHHHHHHHHHPLLKSPATISTQASMRRCPSTFPPSWRLWWRGCWRWTPSSASRCRRRWRKTSLDVPGRVTTGHWKLANIEIPCGCEKKKMNMFRNITALNHYEFLLLSDVDFTNWGISGKKNTMGTYLFDHADMMSNQATICCSDSHWLIWSSASSDVVSRILQWL